MEINFLAILVAALSTFVVGFIWYNPKVFGNAWMKAAGLTQEHVKGGIMLKIFGITFIFALMMAMIMQVLVIHQFGALGMVEGNPDGALPSYKAFMDDYGHVFRTFKHGSLHGFMAGIFLAFPIIGTAALFERRNAKYIFINAGYWVVCMTIMGGILCAWQ